MLELEKIAEDDTPAIFVSIGIIMSVAIQLVVTIISEA
jgi:hypothetical protein